MFSLSQQGPCCPNMRAHDTAALPATGESWRISVGTSPWLRQRW